MNHKLWSDYPELLNKSFSVSITQVIENWEGHELETNNHGRGVYTIGQLIEEFCLDKIGISALMSIKNSIVKIDLTMQTGRERNDDYNEACNVFHIEFANLGDWLAAADIFEELGIGERTINE